MPAHVLFDYHGRQAGYSAGRLFARLIGAVLVLVGLLATVVAIPSGFVTLGDVVNRFQAQPEDLFGSDFPLREVEAAFVASVVVAVAGLRTGRRLIRGRRGVVLFLRRFGYDGAMQVVTFAVADTIGVTWRLVTLDDAEIAPLGVDTSSRVAFSTGERLVWLATRIGSGIFIWFQWAAWGFWAVVGIQAFLGWQTWPAIMRDGTLDTYSAILDSLMDGHVPVAYFGPTLPGAFAIFGTAIGIGLIGLGVMMVVLLAMFPLFGFVMFASSSAEAVRKAEKEKTQTITGSDRAVEIARQVAERGRQTFAPRLKVLRVAGGSWQNTVSALASVATATIIDISEPTENLAWEVFELKRLEPDRCVFIGDRERIEAWVGRPYVELPEDSLERRLARLIEDQTVLAYTTDRRGMRRFAHALYGMLIDVGERSPSGVVRDPARR